MKIIVEIESGIVSGVYFQGPDTPKGQLPEVFVVDLDGLAVGEPIRAEQQSVRSIGHASGHVQDALSSHIPDKP